MAAGVKRRVLIECGAAETRAACLLGDDVTRFWFGPARGDEMLPRPPQTGDLYLGRVRTVSKLLGGAFVDLGEGREGFLNIGKDSPPDEGAAHVVKIRRPAIGSKGPLLTRRWRAGRSPQETEELEALARSVAAPSRLTVREDAALRALEAIISGEDDKGVDVIIGAPGAAQALKSRGIDAAIDDAPFEVCGADEALEASFERAVLLPGGARLIIDETEAMAVIDIDTGSASASATGKLNDTANMAAAARLFPELARRGIGGRVVVDFPPPSNAAARRALSTRLEVARRGIYECRPGSLSADGLFDLTAPRGRQTLLEQATEGDGGAPIPGRRFTLDWRAKEAVRNLETALRRERGVRFRFLLGAELHDYIEVKRPQWLARIAEKFGARVSAARDEKLGGRSFDVAQQ